MHISAAERFDTSANRESAREHPMLYLNDGRART
jgi:hypothetical protein